MIGYDVYKLVIRISDPELLMEPGRPSNPPPSLCAQRLVYGAVVARSNTNMIGRVPSGGRSDKLHLAPLAQFSHSRL